MIERSCLNCKQKFNIRKYRIYDAKYCSRKCGYTHKRLLSESINKICQQCRNLFYKPVGLSNKQFDDRLFCSHKCRGIASSSKIIIMCLECNKEFKVVKSKIKSKFCSRKCQSKNRDKGKTQEHIKIRMSKQYKIWREIIFKRDNYTCQICGIKSGCGKRIILNADHIKSFAHFPELRFDINNGRILCEDCHKKTENFGSKGIKNNTSLAKYNLLALAQET